MSTHLLPFAALLFAATPALAQEPSAAAPAAAPAPLLADERGNPLEPTMLQLRDGGILWGGIEAHDESSLAFRRLDNGGRVTLPWGLLDPAQEQELLLRFGYVEVEAEEILIKAHRIPIVDGTELIGLITNRSGDRIYIKTATRLLALPVSRLGGPPVLTQVPALDIYTRAELYQQRRDELATALAAEGAEGALAQLELARFCERILDFEHAVLHYELAADADPAQVTGDVERAALRAAQKAAVQEQVDYLGQADTWRLRKQFNKAFDHLAAFPELYPDSPLQEDMLKLRERLRKAQDKALESEVVTRWHFWLSRLAEQTARDPELTYETTIDFIEEGLTQGIVDAVTLDMARIDASIDEDRVRSYWGQRKRGRVRKASYGVGTWLLGPEKARAGLDPVDEDPADPANAKDKAVQDLEKKVARFVKNQQIQARAKRKIGDGEEPEVFWKQNSSSARAQFIRAFYAEFAADEGLMNVSGVRFSACRTCGGRGVLESTSGAIGGGNSQGQGGRGGGAQNTAGGVRIQACPTCHTVGVVRRVSYR